MSEAQQLSVRVYSVNCTNSKWRIQHIHMPQADCGTTGSTVYTDSLCHR
jgi:hypothetical protein